MEFNNFDSTVYPRWFLCGFWAVRINNETIFRMEFAKILKCRLANLNSCVTWVNLKKDNQGITYRNDHRCDQLWAEFFPNRLNCVSGSNEPIHVRMTEYTVKTRWRPRIYTPKMFVDRQFCQTYFLRVWVVDQIIQLRIVFEACCQPDFYIICNHLLLMKFESLLLKTTQSNTNIQKVPWLCSYDIISYELSLLRRHSNKFSVCCFVNLYRIFFIELSHVKMSGLAVFTKILFY